MFCFRCKKRQNSLTELQEQKKGDDYKVKIPRRKVKMRGVIKSNSPFICFIGPPGSGKSAQARRIVEYYGYLHFDVPELVRNEARQNTSRGHSIRMMMTKKEFPEYFQLDVLKEAMAKRADPAYKPAAWLISGFPSLLEEALMFEKEVGRLGLLVYFTGDVRLLEKNVSQSMASSGRRVPSNLQKNLNLYSKQLRPLLQAYVDRVEYVLVVEDENAVFSALQDVVLQFETHKPVNNKPTTAAHMLMRQRSKQSVGFRTRSTIVRLPNSFDPLDIWGVARATLKEEDEDRTENEEENYVTPPLTRLTSLRPVSRPSLKIDIEQFEEQYAKFSLKESRKVSKRSLNVRKIM